jgi:non-ribosomal peptide synthetase component F
VAVVFGAEQVSDGELNRPVNRLAHYLRKRGVNPNTPVGLRPKRSVEIIIVVL